MSVGAKSGRGPLYWPRPVSVKKTRALCKEITDSYDQIYAFLDANDDAPEEYCWKCKKLLTDKCNLRGNPRCEFVGCDFWSRVKE
jgi:hypothetical protein